MGNVKTCNRDQTIQILQLPAQISRQNLKIPNFKKKVIPTEKPPVRVCFGYKPTESGDVCGICRKCLYNQTCYTKTRINKSYQSKSQFRKMQKKVLNQRIDEIADSLKNL